MIPVSQALKEAFNPNNGQGARYIDYSVTWGVTNQEAQDNATLSASEEPIISRLSQITNGNLEALNIATFENEGFPLDGSVVVPPRVTEAEGAEIGLIMPDLSDVNGNYTTPQVITLSLPYYYDWIALTVNFGHVPASDFSIAYLIDENIVRTHTVTGNMKGVYVDEWAATGCNKVILTITKCSIPFTRARIAEVTFGAFRNYSKSNSQSMEITETIDPLNERVPANELKISVENFASEYNIFDPAGIYTYLRTRQKIATKIGAQQANNVLGYVGMGKYFLLSPELKNSFTRLDLKATDLLGLLQDTQYTKGIFKTATIAQFAQDVATDAGVTISYPASFSELTLSAYIPSVSHAEAFRRIAQATNTLLYTNRDGIICFKQFDNTILQTFTSHDYKNESGLEPSEDTIFNTIEVETVSISEGTTADKLTEVEGAGVWNVKYEPSTGHTITVSGGTLVSAVYYADNAIVNITGGKATINGKKLVISKKTVSLTTAQANEQKLIYTVKEQPFIQQANSNSIATHYLKIKAQKRRTVKMQYRGYPYIEMGDCINFIAGDYLTQAFVASKNALKLGGGMTGTLEAREI